MVLGIAVVGFINPGFLMDQLPKQRLGPTDNVANDAQLMGQPKHLNDRLKGLLTPARRPGQGGDMI